MEVVNMGAIGYSTEQVKVLVREVLEKGEPDLLILYSGNNEFLDVKARIAMAELDGRRATRVRGYLETHSVTARLIRSLLPATKNMIRKDEEILSGYLQIKPGPEQIRETDLRYERNLREMIGAARAKNVPFVLCTLIANPQFESFDRSLFGGELEGNPDSRNIYQAAGWARLGRWDKAREALAPLAFLGERRNLLRIFEAGGVRGIDKLSAEAKTDLQKTARAVIEDATAHPDRDESDLYALAISYRLLDDGENLAKVLAKVDQQLRSDRDADHRLGREVLFSQFAGEETYHSAFKSLWAGERATVWATPATNEIVRRVAAGEGAPLADLEKELSDWLDPTPSRYLLDYCHFNIEGAFETAYLLFKTALSARILPPNPERIDPRAVLLAPDLEWLRTKAYDFLERDKYMGLDFRVCFVYCQPHPREAALDEWFEEDSKKEPDADVVSAFKKNRFYYKKI